VLKKDNQTDFIIHLKERNNIWERILIFPEVKKPAHIVNTKRDRIRVFRKGETVTRKDLCLWMGFSTASSFEVNKRQSELLRITIYEPGENVNTIYDSVCGKMLVTFERNGIYEYNMLT